MLSYEEETDREDKISNLLKITDFINTIFKPSYVQKNRLRIYNILALWTLFYGSENWKMKAKDKGKIADAEMKFMRQTVKYIQATKHMKIYARTKSRLHIRQNVNISLQTEPHGTF
jgi:hypothetical protein